MGMLADGTVALAGYSDETLGDRGTTTCSLLAYYIL